MLLKAHNSNKMNMVLKPLPLSGKIDRKGYSNALQKETRRHYEYIYIYILYSHKVNFQISQNAEDSESNIFLHSIITSKEQYFPAMQLIGQ